MQDYQRLLSSQPARRLNPAKLAESSVLKNKLVDTIAFLENLAVKDSAEKDLFFKRLPQAIPGLPLPVLRRKLLPMLAQALTFGGAPAVALGSILQVTHCGMQIIHSTLCLGQMTAQSTAVPTSCHVCIAPHIWCGIASMRIVSIFLQVVSADVVAVHNETLSCDSRAPCLTWSLASVLH